MGIEQFNWRFQTQNDALIKLHYNINVTLTLLQGYLTRSETSATPKNRKIWLIKSKNSLEHPSGSVVSSQAKPTKRPSKPLATTCQMCIFIPMLSHGTVLYLTSNGHRTYSKTRHLLLRSQLFKSWSLLLQALVKPNWLKKNQLKLRELRSKRKSRRKNNQLKNRQQRAKEVRSQAKRETRRLLRKLQKQRRQKKWEKS